MQARTLRAIAFGAASALLTAPGCDRPALEKAARADSSSAPNVTRVTTVRPERATIARATEEPGQIEASEVAPLHAKLGGYVRSLAVDIGDKVKKGQVLAELHVPEAEAELKQKRAMIDQAQAEMKQTEAAVEVAQAGVASARAKVVEIGAGVRRTEADITRWQAEFARVRQLVSDRALTGSLQDETQSKLAASEAARDEVRAKVQSAEAAVAESLAALDKAKADVAAASAHVEVARFEAEKAEALASYARIEAPFDGVVVRRNADTGHLTVPGATGEPLLVVARSGVVTISVGVPEADAAMVNAGDPAKVRLQALDGRIYEGKVTRTSWALDAGTRTLRAEIDVPNPDDALRPGLYAYASIVAEERRDALSLPVAAIVREGDKTLCVVVSGGKASRRPIKVGLSDGKRTEVLSGLEGNEAVAVANAATLADGQAVEPTEVQNPAK